MLSAAVTSVIGSAYTSVSFLKSFSRKIQAYENGVIIVFILVSTVIFVTIGQPVRLLILAGALNGLVLPLTLGVMVYAAYKPKIVGTYRHPLLLTVFGVLVVLVMAYLGGYTLVQQLPKLFAL